MIHFTVYRRSDITPEIKAELHQKYDLSNCDPIYSNSGVWGMVTDIMTHPGVETYHKTQKEAEALLQTPEWKPKTDIMETAA